MRRLILIAILSLLAACSSLSLREPEVHLVNLRIGPTEGLSQQLDVELLIINPNKVALELDAMRYQLRVEGHSLVSGHSVVPLSVPAGGEVRYTVPARVNLLAGIDLLRVLMAQPQQSLEYQLDAELDPRRGWRNWHIQRKDRLSLSP